MNDDANIIIKGGSIDLIFDSAVYPQDPPDPRSHRNPSKKISRIVITGDISFDTGDHPSGLSCMITVFAD